MAETSKPITTHQIDYVCDVCGMGTMKPTGVALMSCPAQYPHRCSACDAPATFLKQYPCIEWREIDHGL